MNKLIIVAKIADSIISLGLLLVGCYLFFFERLWITGAFLIAVHQFYQIGTVYCMKNFTNLTTKE